MCISGRGVQMVHAGGLRLRASVAFPVLLRLPAGIPPAIHGLFEVAAVLVGARLYVALRSRRSDPVPDTRRTTVLIGAAVGALVGSRALAALEHPGLFDGASASQAMLLLYGTKTIVGGLLGGLLGVEATKRVLGERRRTGDLFVYPLILAIAIGRVGCFLTGVTDGTTGVATGLPWAVDHGDGVPRHPAALYEILFLAALAVALRQAEKRWALPNGALFALFMAGYLGWRLAVEFLKPVEPLALGLSAIQWACVLGLLHYARLALGRHFAMSPAPARV